MSKSASSTPAPLVDRIRGSKKNKAGSAATKKSAQSIKLNASMIAGLTKKAKEYNEKHPKSKVSVTTLKAVMRRGMGAYSSSHRPTITGGAPNTRQAWAYARVNAFLRKKGGQGAKPTYVQDNDLLADGGEVALLKVGQILHLRRLPMFKRSGDLGKQREVNKKVVEVISRESWIDEDEANQNNKHKTSYFFKADDNKKYSATFWGNDLISVSNDKVRYEAITNKLAHGGQLGKEITCVNCGWHWNTNDSDPSDKYVCHKCGYDNRTYYDSDPIGKMADGGAVGVPTTEKLIDLVRKDRENIIKESYKLGYKVVVARNDGYAYKKESETDYEFIDAKNPSAKKVLEIIKNNPDVTEIRFNGTIKVGNRVGEPLEIVDDFSVSLWKKDNTFFAEGLKFQFTRDNGKYINTIVNKNDTITYKDRVDDGKYVYFKQLDLKYNTTSEMRTKKEFLKEEFDNNEAMFVKHKMADGGLTKTLAIADIHKKYNELPKSYINAQLYIGMKAEMEHTKNPDVAKKIALDHLNESPFYYEYLTKMEKQLEGLDVKKHYDQVKDYAKGGEINPDNKGVKDYFAHGSGNVGGVLVGKRHSEGGIKAVNKSTNQPLEMEGGEVVITRNAVSDNEKREFEGEMLTNKEILSRINESGGGVSFADGGDIPESIHTSGKEYAYGGKMVKDHDIVTSCGCKHTMADGGKLLTQEFNEMYAHKFKSGGQLYGQGGVLRIIDKEIPTYLAFQELFNGLKVPDLRKEYEGFLKENYKINFTQLPQKIRTGLLLGSQKLIDNYINA
jgi:hypothetical protein